MILFTKFSNDRSREHAICTRIEEEGGQRIVVKSALYPEGLPHIASMREAYTSLSALFSKTAFVPNRLLPETSSGEAAFEYVSGTPLSVLLRERLSSDRDGFFALFDEFMSGLDRTADTCFSMSDGFREVFGSALDASAETLLTPALPASGCADLDLIPENVLVSEASRTVIDYEWTFAFPVPVAFIKWRAVHYFLRGEEGVPGITEEALLERAGVDRRLFGLFSAMEEALQTWIAGDCVPLWKLYPEISPGVRALDLDDPEETEEHTASVYFDRGGGYSEEDCLKLSFTGSLLSAVIPASGARSLRLDPAEEPTALVLERLSAGEQLLEPEQLVSNGYTGDHRTWYFTTSDPQLILPALPEDCGSVSIRLRLLTGTKERTSALETVLSGMSEELLTGGQRLKGLQETVRRMTAAVEAVKGTRAVRAYREARAALKKSDPFDSVRPVLRNREGVYLTLDRCEAEADALYAMGWFLDPESPGYELEVVCGDGSKAPAGIRRVFRRDVNERLGLTDGRRTGFDIRIGYEAIPELPFYLRFETARGVLTEKLPLEPDYERRRQERRAGQLPAPPSYDLWAVDHDRTEEEREAERTAAFPYEPKISVVIPLYETPRVFLKEIVDSVLNQTYGKLELCLADGSADASIGEWLRIHYGEETRIRYRHLDQNGGISDNTNAAIEEATGEWILFADHDDVLDLSACYEIVKKINEDERTDAVYTDEDKITACGHFLFGPHFKSGFNPVYLRTNNYICHIFAVRRSVLAKTGLLRSAYDGAQDYDLVLRVSEHARLIAHVPKVLYHWRSHGGSTAGNPESKLYAFESGRRAVEDHLRRTGRKGRCELTEDFGHYRVYLERTGRPFISILIPNRDHPELLRRAVGSLLSRTAYDNYEILILENGSTNSETLRYYEELRTSYPERIRLLVWEGEFNYAAINNFGVRSARGEYLLFLNNDIEVTESGWLDAMIAELETPGVGAVGAYLTYPDGRIQHCGVVIGLGGAAGHLFGGLPQTTVLGGGRAQASQNFSAVTAACMLTKTSCFNEAGGFDEQLKVAYNDIDYCLKLRARGLQIVLCAEARLIHDESASRGYDVETDEAGRRRASEKARRLAEEAAYFEKKWPHYFKEGDPYYNPNLSLTRPDYALRD